MLHSNTTSAALSTPRLTGALYQVRLAQAEAVKSVIVRDGETDGQVRMVFVDGEAALVSVVAHPAGAVLHFLAFGPGFPKERDLTILPTQSDGYEGSNYDMWLTCDGRTFPHGGKYRRAARLVLRGILAGQ